MDEGDGLPRLLVVDDEPALVDLHEMALAGDYDVETAYGGPEALAVIEREADFDLALIDRRMPEVSGDEVLDRLREASPDCRAVMVTAVEPDFDVVDMPFDEYLVKPVSRSTIRETVERLLRLKRYREQCRDEYSIARKVATLRAHKDPEALEEHQEYAELVDELEAARETLSQTTDAFSHDDFSAAFAEIGELEPPASGSG